MQNIATPSYAHRQMSPDLQLVADLMGGTRTMRQAGLRWLPREAAESWLAWRQAPMGVQIGLFSMACNLGLPRLSSFKLMRKALLQGDYSLASREALRSKWAGQVGIRATQIAQLFKGDLSCLEGKVSE